LKNILFISRDFLHKGNLKQAELYQQEHINIINNSWMNTGNGFFYNSLKTIGKLSISFGIINTVNLLKKSRFDLLVFELKFFIYSKPSEEFIKFIKELNYPIILLLGYDGNFSKVINLNKLDEIINFKIICIPNLLKNIETYNLSKKIVSKILVTHYGLGNQDLVYDLKKKKINNDISENIITNKKYDIFFAGSTAPDKHLRNDFIKKIKNDKRLDNYRYSIDIFETSFKVNNIKKENFIKLMKQSNISLDLSGSQDNITMRFNEIILNNELPITDRGFKNYWVSNYYKNIIDDFCFNDIDQFFYLVDKYKNLDNRKNAIRKIKAIWNDYYDPFEHGKDILKRL